MKSTWIISDNIVSSLGITTEENYKSVRSGKTGITPIKYSGLKDELYLGKIADGLIIDNRLASYTRFEKTTIRSAEEAISKTSIDTKSRRTIFILSSTKGNIELLEQGKEVNKRIHLHETAKIVASHFKNPNTPVVISNACISGVMAILVGKYLLESDQYDHAVVVGADTLSYFVISGFQSLMALSPEVCKPFDKNRKGINLGEAASTVILSSNPTTKGIRVLGGGLSNDANHISGPSRTGAELNTAIKQALKESEISKNEIDFISAHGTATIYNDEMEAKAFHLAGMNEIPLNSLKGYFGHTLGGAGIIETVISIQALRNNELIASHGYEESGVSQPINVIRKSEQRIMNTFLKTASGFGGCNAAMIIRKEN